MLSARFGINSVKGATPSSTHRVSHNAFGLNLSLLLPVLLIVLAITPGAHADTISVQSVADADIEQHSPNSNFGGDISVVSGTLGSNIGNEIRRALFRFDLSGKLPAGAVINSVTVQLKVVKIPASSANSTFDLRRILQNWSETSVTWNQHLPGAPWASPGAMGPGDCAAASSSVFVSGLGTYTFPSTPALVADVQSWADQPSGNFGWLLVSEQEVTPETARRWGAHEDPANAPVLTVDFSPPHLAILTPPQSQSVSADATVLFSVSASGVPPLQYQWRFQGQDIQGANSSLLVLSNVQTNAAGVYEVVVSDQTGGTTNTSATLSVQPIILPLPTVRFVTPTNGQRFVAHSDVVALVDAEATNGTILAVNFSLGTNQLASVTNPPYSITLTNVPAGSSLLSAIAIDSNGFSNSAVVFFQVFELPQITITHPVEGQKFVFGTNILLQAAATSSGPAISNVVFFADDQQITTVLTAPYTFQWTPDLARDYVLTAVVVDETGVRVTSAPVKIRVFLPDSTKPTLAITNAPANFSRFSAASIKLAGTAADNIGLDHVEAQINGGGFNPVSGTNAWEADLTLLPGKNTVQVRSVDLAGNTSFPSTRFYTYTVISMLQVRTVGQGSVTPNLNSRLLQVGSIYALNARPARGNIFGRWTGAPFQGPALRFMMQSNLILVAEFVPNPFMPVQGVYSGLISSTNPLSAEGNGLLSLLLSSSGAFSCHVTVDGKTYSTHGQFGFLGHAHAAVLRSALQPIALSLDLDLTNAPPTIRGVAAENDWVATFGGDRNVDSAPQAGNYSFSLSAPGQAPEVEGKALISKSGMASFSGMLREGRRFSFGTRIAADGSAPFYVSINRTNECLAGRMQFSSTSPFVSGSVQWILSGTNGFSTALTVSP